MPKHTSKVIRIALSLLLLAATSSFVPAAVGRAPECSVESAATRVPQAEAQLASALVAPQSVVRTGQTAPDGAVAPGLAAAPATAFEISATRIAQREPDPFHLGGREICLRNSVLLI